MAVVKRTNEMTIEITAQHPAGNKTLTKISARGTCWTRGDPTTMRASSIVSIGEYGERLYPVNPEWLPDTTAGQVWCSYIVAKYKDPHTILTMSFVASKDAVHMKQALSGLVGDRVTIDADGASGLGINADFWIENIHHSLDMGKTRHIVTYELVECP